MLQKPGRQREGSTELGSRDTTREGRRKLRPSFAYKLTVIKKIILSSKYLFPPFPGFLSYFLKNRVTGQAGQASLMSFKRGYESVVLQEGVQNVSQIGS